jgi:hypothetical protein
MRARTDGTTWVRFYSPLKGNGIENPNGCDERGSWDEQASHAPDSNQIRTSLIILIEGIGMAQAQGVPSGQSSLLERSGGSPLLVDRRRV